MYISIKDYDRVWLVRRLLYKLKITVAMEENSVEHISNFYYRMRALNSGKSSVQRWKFRWLEWWYGWVGFRDTL